MPILTQTESLAEPLLKLVVAEATARFKERTISIFKIGSLGNHGDFSLCSDVDVALMLDTVKETDYSIVQELQDKIKSSDLAYADRLSIFWSCYDQKIFEQGKGRFPPLDRLDMLRHGVLLEGIDRRQEFSEPGYEALILESAKFISENMLAGEKFAELTMRPAIIASKGARYFSKFVLFPIRLIYTLDYPNIIGSNRDAVEHVNKTWGHLIPGLSEIANNAYQARNNPPAQSVAVDIELLKTVLLRLYQYCITRYYDAVMELGCNKIAAKVAMEKHRLDETILLIV